MFVIVISKTSIPTLSPGAGTLLEAELKLCRTNLSTLNPVLGELGSELKVKPLVDAEVAGLCSSFTFVLDGSDPAFGVFNGRLKNCMEAWERVRHWEAKKQALRKWG
jgi:hypothetical protein